VLFLHQVHQLDPTRWREFDDTLRSQWMPAIAKSDDARLCWAAYSLPCEVHYPEALTMIAVSDPTALEALAGRIRGGDLADVADRIGSLRLGAQTRVLAPLRFNPLEVDLAAVPTDDAERTTYSYMHDFVPPIIGQRRGYEDRMVTQYMAMSDKELVKVVLWAGLEPVIGGGPVPEQVNISRIIDADAVVGLLSFDIPRENKQLGTWMHEALAVRDTWTTRLVRSTPWSPLA
jgi:hypothetical protein